MADLFDQDFGSALLDDDPFFARPSSLVPYWLRSHATPSLPNISRGVSEVTNDDTKFAINADASHFAPEEIKLRFEVM